VKTQIEAGTGTADLVLQTAATATAANLTLNDPIGATPTGATLTFTNTPTIEDTSATGQTAVVTKFAIRNGADTVCVTGDVGTSTGTSDIALSSTTINAGDKVQVTSLTYTAPV